MKIVKENLETNIIQLEITVPAADFENALQKSYVKNVKSIAVQGFRKGKAPRKLIEKTHGAQVFYEDAVDFALQDTYPVAIEQAGIDPVSKPDIDIKQVESGKEMIYTAKITVKPQVALGDYKGIEVEKIEYTVTDDEVDAEINNMKERTARFVDVTDLPVADGNVAVIDFEGFVDGVAFAGGKGENHNLTIGSGQFIPGFEEQLIGKNLGEECDVLVIFPAEYQSEELAGKEAMFKVKINGIKNKEYPVLDDEFAKDVSEFDTFEELKASTRGKLEVNATNRSEKEQFEKIIDKIVENTTVEIPDVMVENQIEEYIQDAKYKIEMQMPGITFEKYLEYTGGSIDDFKEGMKDRGQKDVKTSLILEEIAKRESISVDDKDIDEEIEKVAEQYKMEKEKVSELIKADQVRESLISRKTIDFLKENAIIK